jgi:hypothetical protein
LQLHGSELDVSKGPDEAAALLLRIATLKWQAVTVIASSSNGLAREDAACFLADLDGIAAALRGSPTLETTRALRERVEALARLRDHEPRRRTAGR